MSKFSKNFPIEGKSAQEIYTTISNGIDHFLSKTPVGGHDIKRDEAAKQVSFKSSMASGTLTATDGALLVEVSLSLLATPFKSKLDEGVTKWLNKTFAINS
jgi:hypothetical protein